jgi:hypothetical protein
MHAGKLLILMLIGGTILTGRVLFGQAQEELADPFHPKTTVVVTATRSEVELDKSPVSTNILTLKEITLSSPPGMHACRSS